jgi:cobalt-zinc-cadmium efflux system membrane fusion protein
MAKALAEPRSVKRKSAMELDRHKFRLASRLGLLAVAAGVLAAVVWIWAGAASTKLEEAPQPMMVKDGTRIRVPDNSPLRSRLVVAAVTQSAATHSLSVPAVVEADAASVASVLAPLTGRVTRIAVNVGDHVEAHQVLAVLDSPDLTQAVADVGKARDAEQLAQRALERAKGVTDAGAIAQKDLEQAASADVQARAEAARAEGRLNALTSDPAGVNGRQLVIRAATSGYVTALNVGTGSLINDVTAPLMSIANLDSVWISARVPEDSSAAVSKGLNADIVLPALPRQLLHGTVSSVSAVVDADSRRVVARIRMPNRDGRLKPNMFATVSLAIAQPAATNLPSSALLMDNDSITVLVEVAPWVFERRSVEIGSEDGEVVHVISGVKPGDRVVVRGGVLLND